MAHSNLNAKCQFLKFILLILLFQDDQFLPTVPDANIMSLLLEAEDSLSQLDILSKSNLQPKTICGIIKPICPALTVSCRLCKQSTYFSSTKSCQKTCQTSKQYCSTTSPCGSSSSTPTEPPLTEISEDGNEGNKIFYSLSQFISMIKIYIFLS